MSSIDIVPTEICRISLSGAGSAQRKVEAGLACYGLKRRGKLMADDVRILPTEWVGTVKTSSWGVVTPHHPHFFSHAHLELGWHTTDNNAALRIDRQVGPFLELTFIASNHASKAVGVLSADSRRLKVATLEVTFHLVVDGDHMSGDGEARAHGSTERRGSFAAKMVELTAKS